MRRDHRRQIAMQRDWSWQTARARQKTARSSFRLHPLFVVLLALVIVAAVVGIVLTQHAGQRASTGSAARPAQQVIGTPGAPGAQTATASDVRTGVFALSNGGPIPVPANVLKPVNIARTVLNNEIYSIYAGSLTRQPEIGVLVVLQENVQSGQETLHTYQSPQHHGALTILSLQQNIVTFSAASDGQGRFDLLTDQFQLA